MAPKWCTRMESNHRRARLQRAALPLSYLCETDCAKWSGRWEIEPIVPTLATWCSTIELRPRIWWARTWLARTWWARTWWARTWWAGMDSNHLRMNGAFTERWAHQCPACPKLVAGAQNCLQGGSRIRLEQLMRLPGARTSLRESCE